VSLLRWYSAVIPMAMGALCGLTALLGTALRARQHSQWVRLDGASRKDLEFWRWILGVGLLHPRLWSAPFWFLAGKLQDRVTNELFKDASTSIGGGYVLGNISFRQFRWEEAEKRQFASSADGPTDINVLEFVVAVPAVISEREHLRGTIVLLRVDNMSEVSWLNRLRLNHLWGQSWMRLLIATSLCIIDIRIVCSHIPAVDNPIADGLSRYFQETTDQLRRMSLQRLSMPTWVKREAMWRGCGNGLKEEWAAILEELMGQDLHPYLSTGWDFPFLGGDLLDDLVRGSSDGSTTWQWMTGCLPPLSIHIFPGQRRFHWSNSSFRMHSENMLMENCWGVVRT
jgi:hypothetical protein